MHMILKRFGDRALGALALFVAPIAVAEDWPGYEKNAAATNASTQSIEAGTLRPAWQATFTDPYIGGKAWRPEPEINPDIRAHLHSRNLVVLDGKVALVATGDLDKSESQANGPFVTILDASTGEIANLISVRLDKGNNGMRGKFPEYPVFNGAENFHGAANLWWDPETQALFLAAPGDSPTHSAYLPLANLDAYQEGEWQNGAPAFQELVDAHGEVADVFGVPRSQAVAEASGKPVRGADAWGLDLRFAKRARPGDGGPARWLQTVPSWNRSSFFSVDEDGPLVVFQHSAGHGQTGKPIFVNKHTGQLVYDRFPPRASDWPEFNDPFLRWGGSLIGDDRVYFFGPSGNAGGKFVQNPRAPAQDLNVWAYDFFLADEQPNDGLTGDAALDTLTLTPVFHHSLKSSNVSGEAESWVELDAFYRNKAALIGDGAIWIAWKPSRAGHVKLVRADESGVKTFDLGVGAGLAGHDLWPHLAWANVRGRDYIVYYAGVGQTRERVKLEVEKNGKEQTIDAWSSDLDSPDGHAELAIFDVAQGETVATYDLSEIFATLPPNVFWGYLERSFMTVAGQYAVVGWVETTQGPMDNAQVALSYFDLANPGSPPTAQRFDLGFPAADFPLSILNGMIAVDGRVFAHVLQSHELAVDNPVFSAQHVLALE